MAFRPPPAILQRVMRLKAINHKDGKFLLWGIPCFISQLYAYVYLYKLIESRSGKKESMSLNYSLGKLQGKQGFRMISKRFGYAETMHDKKMMLEFNSGQAELVGIGSLEWLKMDFDANHFILRVKSPIAEEYKRFFGLQKEPVDHFIRGEMTAYIEEISKKKIFTVETVCSAMGKPYCEFVSKPVEDWNKKDPMVKKQWVDDIPDMKKLGAKIEPYLVLRPG
jgi:predicted hydrocarbon binding protein